MKAVSESREVQLWEILDIRQKVRETLTSESVDGEGHMATVTGLYRFHGDADPKAMLRHPLPVRPTVLPRFVQLRGKERGCLDSISLVFEWIYQLGWDLEGWSVVARDIQ